MNGIRIRDLAQLDAGRKIDTLQCRLWIYEACEKLSVAYLTACITAQETITAEPEKWVEVGIDNNRGVYKVTKNGREYDAAYYSVKLEGEKTVIKFADKGEFTVHAYVPAPILPSLSSAPQLNPAYHQALVKYVAAKKRFATNRRDPVGMDLMAEFYRLADDADDTIKRMKKKNARIPARPFR